MSTCSSSISNDFGLFKNLKGLASNDFIGKITQNKEKILNSLVSSPINKHHRSFTITEKAQSKNLFRKNTEPHSRNFSENIDSILGKIQNDISNQSHRIQTLRKNMQEYDNSVKKILKNENKDAEKNRFCEEVNKKNIGLKEELKRLEKKKEENISDENQKLEAILKEKIMKKNKLMHEISEINAENLKINTFVTKNSKNELIIQNKELKNKVFQMSSELAKYRQSSVTNEEFLQMHDQLKDLEIMQRKVIQENNYLRNEIIKEQKREMMLFESHVQQKNLCREVAMIRKDISMVNCIAKSIFSQEKIDLGFLLEGVSLSQIEDKSLNQALTEIDSELTLLKKSILSKEKNNLLHQFF